LVELENAAVAGDHEALHDLCDWLDRSALRHEADEEKSLFPRLASRPELADLLSQLSDEHRAHERLHAALRASIGGEPGRVVAIARELAAAYRKHVEEEEAALFPAARALVGDAERAAMTEEMQSRRGRGRRG
jgi:hemerythrin-like domain-containing protein